MSLKIISLCEQNNRLNIILLGLWEWGNWPLLGNHIADDSECGQWKDSHSWVTAHVDKVNTKAIEDRYSELQPEHCDEWTLKSLFCSYD